MVVVAVFREVGAVVGAVVAAVGGAALFASRLEAPPAVPMVAVLTAMSGRVVVAGFLVVEVVDGFVVVVLGRPTAVVDGPLKVTVVVDWLVGGPVASTRRVAPCELTTAAANPLTASTNAAHTTQAATSHPPTRVDAGS